MTPYDDDIYIQLCELLRTTINALLEMEGNDKNLIREEVDNILEDQ